MLIRYFVNTGDRKFALEVIDLSQNVYNYFLRFPLVIRILLMAFFIMGIFGTFIHLIEPTNFPTVFDGIWWAIVTASTVGYGDFVPKSILGRIAGIFLIFLGASFLTFYFSNLATVAVTKQNEYLEGKRLYKGRGHLIIIGWNERSREMVEILSKEDKGKQMILIDESLGNLPVKQPNVHFIKGRSNRDETLINANLHAAECVIITADPNKDELQTDMHTILTLLAIKGLNPSVKCIVEILTAEQVLNAGRAGADEVIRSNKLISSAMLSKI
jgi:voltage-gated potassium channel